jgi:hypothetical protein
MNFNGRWVSPELMNLILMLWLIAAVIIGVWLCRMQAKAKQHPKRRPPATTAKRHGKKKR